MTAAWGQGRARRGVVSMSSFFFCFGSGSFPSADNDDGEDVLGLCKGVVVVMAGLTKCSIRSDASAGVTWSTKMKAGRRRTVVGCCAPGSCWWYSSGTGMLEAESLSFYG